MMNLPASQTTRVEGEETIAEKLEKVRARNETKKRNSAANKIQTKVRSYLARKKADKDIKKWTRVAPGQRVHMLQRVNLSTGLVAHYNPIIVDDKLRTHLNDLHMRLPRWHQHSVRMIVTGRSMNLPVEVKQDAIGSHEDQMALLRRQNMEEVVDEVINSDDDE